MAKDFELREDLSENIYKMLENASPLTHKNQINQENSHESLQQKQIFLTKLIQKSGVQINGLDHTKKGAIKMNFYRMLGNLNSLLLGQYLMKMV